MILKTNDKLVNTCTSLHMNEVLIVDVNNFLVTYWDIWLGRKITLSPLIIEELEAWGRYKFKGDDLWVKKESDYGIMVDAIWSLKILDFVDPYERFRRMPLTKFNIKKHLFDGRRLG